MENSERRIDDCQFKKCELSKCEKGNGMEANCKVGKIHFNKC